MSLLRPLSVLFMLFTTLGTQLCAEQYQWGTLPIGGGGYVTGIVIHPTTPDRTYIRTDVGGAYRWDSTAPRWVQMLDWLGPAEANLVGVDGIAIDANKPDRVYLALGKGSGSAGGVYRSNDQGSTWQKLLTARFEGNGRDLRWAGECLAVDPRTSNVIYCGTRLDGLWRSTDEGTTWAKVSGVPNGFTGTNPTGVRAIVFDPTTAVGGKSSLVYVAVPGSGVYRSTDAGATFAAMAGAPSAPRRMQVVAGHVFVSHASGVALWSGGAWSNITPASGAGKDYCALAVDPTDWRKVVVTQRYSSYFNPMYRSVNGGSSWAQINTSAAPATLHVEVPWWQQNRFSAATAGMAFDPFHAGQLFYTDWFGIWRTPNVWATPMDWYTQERGHEETVVLGLVAPSSGAMVLSCMADNFGFRSTDVTSYPTKKLYPMAEGVSIAVCEQHPENIAVLGASSWAGANLTMATSSDSGATWATHGLPAGAQLGRLACASTDPARLIYVAGGGGVYFSSNRGNSWNASTGAPTNAIGLSDIWNKDFAIAADSVDGNRFYLFSSGKLYATTDGGATWAAQNASAIPGKSGYLNVVACPGVTREVWVSLDGNGLWRTTNGGTNFTQISGFSKATLFSFGAPPSGSTTATAYCYGTRFGVVGLFRSTDLGATWLRINDNDHQFPAGAKTLAADRQVFGRVFIGSGGCGIFYGQTASVSVVAPAISSQPQNTTVTAGQTATFSLTASGSPTLTYQWQKNGTTISGATSASYTTPATISADTSATFRCVVSNSAGSVTSNTATLTVTPANVAPVMTSQPANKTVSVGQTATFSVTASGTPTPTFQWQKTGATISGATSASYTTPATVSGDTGAAFRCIVSNSAGSVTSNSATLTVNVLPVIGNGSGLSGAYFDNQDLSGSVVLRTDANIDFTWSAAAAPVSGIAPLSY